MGIASHADIEAIENACRPGACLPTRQPMKPVVLDEHGAYVRDCADGEIGVLLISGPDVFDGYLNPAQNERLFPDLGDGRRWLDTGDLARRDADGYFWLTGRKKELIIRGGHNIDPATIEIRCTGTLRSSSQRRSGVRTRTRGSCRSHTSS